MISLVGCNNAGNVIQGSTGAPRNTIEQPQLMYNDTLYYFFATDLVEEIPDEYEKMGSIEGIDAERTPEKNFWASGIDMAVGQEIYACTKDTNEIYVKYNNSFRLFETRK